MNNEFLYFHKEPSGFRASIKQYAKYYMNVYFYLLLLQFLVLLIALFIGGKIVYILYACLFFSIYRYVSSVKSKLLFMRADLYITEIDTQRGNCFIVENKNPQNGESLNKTLMVKIDDMEFLSKFSKLLVKDHKLYQEVLKVNCKITLKSNKNTAVLSDMRIYFISEVSVLQSYATAPQ